MRGKYFRVLYLNEVMAGWWWLLFGTTFLDVKEMAFFMLTIDGSPILICSPLLAPVSPLYGPAFPRPSLSPEEGWGTMTLNLQRSSSRAGPGARGDRNLQGHCCWGACWGLFWWRENSGKKKQFSKAFGKVLLLFLNHQREKCFGAAIKRTWDDRKCSNEPVWWLALPSEIQGFNKQTYFEHLLCARLCGRDWVRRDE